MSLEEKISKRRTQEKHTTLYYQKEVFHLGKTVFNWLKKQHF